MTKREDSPTPPVHRREARIRTGGRRERGSATAAEVGAEWTAENLANMSLMHSGRWQRRSGARLATEFMPARAYAGYGRNRGEFVPVDPKDYPTLEREMEEERARNADFDPDAPYVEKDPNFMNPADVKSDRSRRLAEYERELAALESRRGLNATTRVHSDSALPPKTGKPRPGPDTRVLGGSGARREGDGG